MTTLCPAPVDLEELSSARLRGRARRVLLLLSVIILLSLADLYLSILYAQGGALAEGNPLARAIMQARSTELIVAWKLASLVIAVGILYRVRRTLSAEIGAWVCCCVLAWLTFQWRGYVNSPPLSSDMLSEFGYDDSTWVTLGQSD